MTISETGISTNMPMMLLKNPADLEAERNLEKSIGRAIGYPLEKLETTLNESLKAFRAELFTHVDKTVKERGDFVVRIISIVRRVQEMTVESIMHSRKKIFWISRPRTFVHTRLFRRLIVSHFTYFQELFFSRNPSDLSDLLSK